MDSQLNLNSISYEDKVEIFTKLFSSCSNLSGSFEKKIELINCLCFLSFKMKEKDPMTYSNTLLVLEKLYPAEFNEKNSPFKSYLTGLSIVCDDLLYNVKTINNPGFKNAQDIVIKVKELINEWMPF